jgi:hypothetical protein
MITDQYGRYFAIFIFSPYLIYKSYVYNDYILLILGLLLLFYEIFWIYISGPQVIYLK